MPWRIRVFSRMTSAASSAVLSTVGLALPSLLPFLPSAVFSFLLSDCHFSMMLVMSGRIWNRAWAAVWARECASFERIKTLRWTYLSECLPVLLHQFLHHLSRVDVWAAPHRLIQEMLDVLTGSFQDEIGHWQGCDVRCCVGKLSNQRRDVLNKAFTTGKLMLRGSVTYSEALSEEGLVADWRKRYHHHHGEQARQRDRLTSLKDCGNVRLSFVDLTSECKGLCYHLKAHLLPQTPSPAAITFLRSFTLSCQVVLRRGVYAYWVSLKYLGRISGLAFSTSTTRSATSSSSTACFRPTKNWSRTRLPALQGSVIQWFHTGSFQKSKNEKLAR